MSLNLVENEVAKFLASKEPDALCISGKWGVGKTFSWNRWLSVAQQKTQVGLDRYAYVSLFGLNSLDELKYAIFENTIKTSQIGVEPSIQSLGSMLDTAEGFGRKYAWLAKIIPGVKSYVGGAAPAFFLTIRNQLICIDDLERKGGALDVGEVLGLISLLKEQRKCKVVLLLNNEALAEESRKTFDVYFERVIDVSMRFAPSTVEAVGVALPGPSEMNKLIAANCISLGLSNIRVMKKIERFARAVQVPLQKFHGRVFQQAVHSLTLFGWCVYEPDVAPSLEYLVTKRGKNPFGLEKKENISEQEAGWNALLDAYEFTTMDELDMVLLDGIRNGFFNPEALARHAEQIDKHLKESEINRSFADAWRLYHDSFQDNEERVLDAIYKSFFESVQTISPINLNGTVMLFKELGRSDQAQKLLNHYMQSRTDGPDFFDLDEYTFTKDISDPDVQKAFRDKFASFHDDRNPVEILLQISKGHSWNSKDVKKLSSLSVDDYLGIFKVTSGKDLRRVIDACMLLGKAGNAAPEERKIAQLAKEALGRIGKESRINSRRVSKYGI